MFTFTRCIATWHVCSIKKVMKFIPNYHIFVIARVFVMTTPTTFHSLLGWKFFRTLFFCSYPIHYLETSGLLCLFLRYSLIYSFIFVLACSWNTFLPLSVHINGALHDNVSTKNEPWVNLASRLMCTFIVALMECIHRRSIVKIIHIFLAWIYYFVQTSNNTSLSLGRNKNGEDFYMTKQCCSHKWRL